MRRERLLPEDEARKIIKAGQYGVMSVISPDGAPYGVPLNYYYDEEKNALFFHCATEGRKLECISANSQVSFTVVTKAEINEPRLTTYYESAMAVGIATLVTDDEAKLKYLRGLCHVLTPSASADSCKSLSHVAVVRISIESVSGKRNVPH